MGQRTPAIISWRPVYNSMFISHFTPSSSYQILNEHWSRHPPDSTASQNSTRKVASALRLTNLSNLHQHLLAHSPIIFWRSDSCAKTSLQTHDVTITPRWRQWRHGDVKSSGYYFDVTLSIVTSCPLLMSCGPPWLIVCYKATDNGVNDFICTQSHGFCAVPASSEMVEVGIIWRTGLVLF